MSDTVTMMAGDRSRTMTRESKLEVERPAGRAELGPVLGHESGGGSDRDLLGQAIDVFNPGARVTLDTLTAGAVRGGERSYFVVASGPGVDDAPDSRGQRAGTIIQPRLTTDVAGPVTRDADIPATDELALGSPGNSPAEDVRVPAEPTAGGGHDAVPPARRPDLILSPPGDGGYCVVKDPRTGSYYNLGRQETFLLSSLDGQRTVAAIRADFETKFGEPFGEEDLDDFLELARPLGWLQVAEGPGPMVAQDTDPAPGGGSGPPGPRVRQSLLYWRISFFDPDRLFDRLEPRLRFLWTRAFLVLSALAILGAIALTWADRQALVTRLPHALRWETVALAWLTLALVTTCHEFAHGLTCKHFGGEVHEVGFLLMFFIPCFYCNVSDAWLFPEKSKRLWVTLAGGYCDLVVWALAVFAWRLTLPDSAPNFAAWVALSICGVRIVFNFNPLLKLDGYYLLSDLLEIPNLRQRGWESWMGHLRWLLWGALRPARGPWGRFLPAYGGASWLYTLTILGLMFVGMAAAWGTRWGLVGAGLIGLFAASILRGLFRGLMAGEVSEMIRWRRKRTAVWAMALGGLPVVLSVGQIEDPVGGSFRVRPATRAELRASVAGFLREVHADEGDRVSPGHPVARLEVPDLESRIARKQAERCESRARLRLLEVGPRPEEVEAQRQRVGRAEAWRDLARRDLDRAEGVLSGDLARLDEQLAQHRAEWEQARDTLARAKRLRDRSPGAVSDEECGEAETKCRVGQARVEQIEAEKRARRAQGAVEAETELALREKQLAEARATLALLEAGTRPEEVDAERARLARLDEELRYQEGLRERLSVASPVAGLIVTPRLRERVGQYFQEGDLIGEVESPTGLEAEITLAEHDAERVRAGQPVALKARALPFRVFRGQVDRIAPVAVPGEVQSTLTVYCRLEEEAPELRPGMTGYARISTGRRSLGEIVADRVLRVLRTEFWW
jgi:multidrug efflux pump subunit AcrA (membrane-fusion protein)